jgi:hypothetical protein
MFVVKRSFHIKFNTVIKSQIHISNKFNRHLVLMSNHFLFDHLKVNWLLDLVHVVRVNLPKCLSGELTHKGARVSIKVQEIQNIPAFLFPNLSERVIFKIINFFSIFKTYICVWVLIWNYLLMVLVPLIECNSLVVFLLILNYFRILIVLFIQVFKRGNHCLINIILVTLNINFYDALVEIIIA